MITLQLTNDELLLGRNALRSFLSDFGRDEVDLITRICQLLDKVDAAQEQGAAIEQLDDVAR